MYASDAFGSRKNTFGPWEKASSSGSVRGPAAGAGEAREGAGMEPRAAEREAGAEEESRGKKEALSLSE